MSTKDKKQATWIRSVIAFTSEVVATLAGTNVPIETHTAGSPTQPNANTIQLHLSQCKLKL